MSPAMNTAMSPAMSPAMSAPEASEWPLGTVTVLGAHILDVAWPPGRGDPAPPHPFLKWPRRSNGYIRLQLPAGAATPAPPVGPALGAQGVNIMAFCKEFNAKTKDQNGMILPVVITVFSDKSFTSS